jgi:hypothetical protein
MNTTLKALKLKELKKIVRCFEVIDGDCEEFWDEVCAGVGIGGGTSLTAFEATTIGKIAQELGITLVAVDDAYATICLVQDAVFAEAGERGIEIQ